MSENRRTSFRNPADESFSTKLVLVAISLVFLAFFLFLPLVSVFYEAFREGWAPMRRRCSNRMPGPRSS